MAKGFSYRFYHSKDWEQARELALQRDAYLCQHCLKAGIATPATMVHHIIELTPSNISDPNIATDTRNLVSLCDLCHKKVHGWARQGSTRQGLCFDEDGNLISLTDENTEPTD
jgi:5-methylcytosine-specific restriction protein A